MAQGITWWSCHQIVPTLFHTLDFRVTQQQPIKDYSKKYQELNAQQKLDNGIRGNGDFHNCSI